MPEFMQENLDYKHVGEEIHPSETSEEKVSLSERFGLWAVVLPLRPGRLSQDRRGLAGALQGAGRPLGSGAARSAAMGPAARLAQRTRGVAVRARLGGEGKDEGGRRNAEVNPANNCSSQPDALHRVGRSPARTHAGASVESPGSLPHPSNRVEVAAAVITGPDGRFLLGQRPAGKVYAGYWEFPGGKIEAGETPLLSAQARVARGTRHRGRARLSLAHPRLRLRARRGAAALFPRGAMVGRAARAREPAFRVAVARCDLGRSAASRQRADPARAAAARRLRHYQRRRAGRAGIPGSGSNGRWRGASSCCRYARRVCREIRVAALRGRSGAARPCSRRTRAGKRRCRARAADWRRRRAPDLGRS